MTANTHFFKDGLNASTCILVVNLYTCIVLVTGHYRIQPNECIVNTTFFYFLYPLLKTV